MPRFFLPYARDDAVAEQGLRDIAKGVHRAVPPHGERIFRLGFRDERVAPGHITTAQVGDRLGPYYDAEDVGEVIAIFAGNPILICTRNRGVLREGPILVGHHEVIKASVEFFDGEGDGAEAPRTLVTPSLNGVPVRSLEILANDVDRVLASGDEAAAGGLTRNGAVKDVIQRIRSGRGEHPIIAEALLWAACQAEPGIADLARAGGVEVKIALSSTEGENGFDCRYEVLSLVQSMPVKEHPSP
jgi:hypothetical protein